MVMMTTMMMMMMMNEPRLWCHPASPRSNTLLPDFPLPPSPPLKRSNPAVAWAPNCRAVLRPLRRFRPRPRRRSPPQLQPRRHKLKLCSRPCRPRAWGVVRAGGSWGPLGMICVALCPFGSLMCSGRGSMGENHRS
jgi:hypothetical protein